MAGRDYRTAATWLVSFGVNSTEGGVYVWLRSTWPERPAQALLQVSVPARNPELGSGPRDFTWLP